MSDSDVKVSAVLPPKKRPKGLGSSDSAVTMVRSDFRAQTRERALSAAQDQLLAVGWDRVRVGSIASAAGVSRPTIYAEFGSKDGLGTALAARENEKFVRGVEVRLARNPSDPAAALKTAIAYTLREAKRSPLLLAVLSTTSNSNDSLLPFLTTRSESLVDGTSQRLTEWWNGSYPYAASSRVREVFDTLVRLTISHVVTPGAYSRSVPARLTAIATELLSDEFALVNAQMNN